MASSLFDGRGNELSEGGMALTAGVELRLGDLVDIEFTPPYSGSPLRHRGIVRNRTGYRYGIEFGDWQQQRDAADGAAIDSAHEYVVPRRPIAALRVQSSTSSSMEPLSYW